MSENSELLRARLAAKETERAARQLVEFANRLTEDIGPADMVEFDNLVAREAAAISERVDAFEALGLIFGSLDATGTGDDIEA